MNYYIANNNDDNNPHYNHEVHTWEHANQLKIASQRPLGYFNNEIEAVNAAKAIYRDADGRAICCHRAHRG